MGDEAVSDSGGTMRRLVEPAGDAVPDLAVLEPLRLAAPEPLRPAGEPPYVAAGEVVAWRYGLGTELGRCVRDDERGLVTWTPEGSERVAHQPRDGRGMRDRSVAERAALAVAGDYDQVVASWRGPGLLKVAPTGVPWSVWFFTDGAGRFEGHYVNLELPHRRPVGVGARTYTRDLTLDLWVADGETWLKDADELEAGLEAGFFTPAQAAAVRAVADQARRDLVDPRAWPLDEGWEKWRPPPGWDEPLVLPPELRPGRP